MRYFLFFVFALAACGGKTTSTSDAGIDAPSDGPISQCNGFCPQPNGSACTSDCDCFEKCVGGNGDGPGTCGDALVKSTPCGGDAAACPPDQTCGPFGSCEGMACKTTTDCPAQQSCSAGACMQVGCI